MSVSLAALPQGLTGSDLVNAVNDRLRRISTALGPDATGVTGAQGAPGIPGTDGTAQTTTVVFGINSGKTGINVTPIAIADHDGTVSRCLIVTKVSDPVVNLVFTIRKNGASIFISPPTVAAATASGTFAVFPVPAITAVADEDQFTLDITSGTSTWQFTAVLAT